MLFDNNSVIHQTLKITPTQTQRDGIFAVPYYLLNKKGGICHPFSLILHSK